MTLAPAIIVRSLAALACGGSVLLAGCAGQSAANLDCPLNFTLAAASDFETTVVEGFAPAYVDRRNRALALNAAEFRDRPAAAETVFDGCSGIFDIQLTTLTETDGESTYRVTIGGRLVGVHTNPATTRDYEPTTAYWPNVPVRMGDVIRVEFDAHTNGKIPEGDGTAYSRGRWVSLEFRIVGVI